MVARNRVGPGRADPWGISSVVLKAAILAGLVFLLPLALACRAVERRYRSARKSDRFGRDRRSAAMLRLRKIRVFLHFSGMSSFSAFLLSGQGRGPLVHGNQPLPRRALEPAAA